MEIDRNHLPGAPAVLPKMVVGLLEELDTQGQRLRQVQHLLEQLLRARYRPKRERVSENQLFLFAVAMLSAGPPRPPDHCLHFPHAPTYPTRVFHRRLKPLSPVGGGKCALAGGCSFLRHPLRSVQCGTYAHVNLWPRPHGAATAVKTQRRRPWGRTMGVPSFLSLHARSWESTWGPCSESPQEAAGASCHGGRGIEDRRPVHRCRNKLLRHRKLLQQGRCRNHSC